MDGERDDQDGLAFLRSESDGGPQVGQTPPLSKRTSRRAQQSCSNRSLAVSGERFLGADARASAPVRPRCRGMTATRAQWRAGVDVNRSLKIMTVEVAVGGKS